MQNPDQQHNSDTICFSPVGYVRSNIKGKKDPEYFKGTESIIEILPEYEEALDGLEEVDSIIVLFFFHKSYDHPLKVHPRGDMTRPLRGVFASHSPERPNLIGVTRCSVIGIKGLFITVRDLDTIDGTPVLDLKPYNK